MLEIRTVGWIFNLFPRTFSLIFSADSQQRVFFNVDGYVKGGETSMSHFIELHFQTAKPVIVAKYRHDSFSVDPPFDTCLFSTDEATTKLMVWPMLGYLMYLKEYKQLHNIVVLSICHGLILCRGIKNFSFSSLYFICNPFTHEMVTLPILEKTLFVCGFIFHQLAKEHRVIYVYKKGGCFCFKIFSLDTNSLRDLSCSYNVEVVPSDATIANGSLHWFILKRSNSLADYILRFDMNIEVFDTVPLPKFEDYSEHTRRVRLLEIEEKLYYCSSERVSSQEVVNIWILADSAKKHWVKRYKINLGNQLKRHPLLGKYYPLRREEGNYPILILGINNDELIFQWKPRGLFTYNLQSGTIRKIEIHEKVEKTQHYSSGILNSVFVYRKSLVSLKHLCKVFKGKEMEGKKWKGMDGYKNYLLFLVQDLTGKVEE